MDHLKLKHIEKLKHQGKVKINGKLFFRTNSQRELNQFESYWYYDFYKKKNRKKNPLATHQVRVYVSFEKNTKKVKWVLKAYEVGKILNLANSNLDQIESIEV